MRYFLIILPWGGYVQVAAASDEQALSIARAGFQRQYGATDLQGMSIAQPGGNTSPYSQGQAPLLNPPTPPAQTQPTQPGGGQPGPGAGIGGTGGTAPTTTLPKPGATGADPDLQVTLRDAAYRRGLGRAGYKPGGVMGRFLMQRAEPQFANFWAQNVLKSGRGDPTTEDYEGYTAGNVPGGSQPLYAESRRRFNELTRGSPQLGRGVEDAFGNLTLANMEAEGSGAMRNNLTELARGAARDQYGAWGTSLLPSDADINRNLQDELYANEAAGQTDPNRRGVDLRETLRRLFGIR